MAHLDAMRDEHAYFLGFFMTDGHLSQATRNRGRGSIELSVVDRPLLEQFADMLDVNSYLTERTRRTNFSTSHTSVVWSFHARSLREELVALGVPAGRKSDLIAPPVVPFDERGFLRGVVDGDGSVGFTATGAPFISFVTASQALAEFFCAQVMAVTGAVRSARRNTRDGVYGLMVANDPAAELAAWLYPADCLALPRKRAAAARVAGWTRPPGMRARPAAKRPWTEEDDRIAVALPVAEAADRLGRTTSAVVMRRSRLRHPGRYDAPRGARR